MKTRISNIEFLRILSMIMIVISHISLYTNWEEISNLSPYSTVRLLGFDTLGPIGAVLFFMIPGFLHVIMMLIKLFINHSIKSNQFG